MAINISHHLSVDIKDSSGEERCMEKEWWNSQMDPCMKELLYTTERMVCYFVNVNVAMVFCNSCAFKNMIEKFKDTKGIIRSHDSEKRQTIQWEIDKGQKDKQ